MTNIVSIRTATIASLLTALVVASAEAPLRAAATEWGGGRIAVDRRGCRRARARSVGIPRGASARRPEGTSHRSGLQD